MNFPSVQSVHALPIQAHMLRAADKKSTKTLRIKIRS